jgi:hypothetical protein
MRTTMTTGKTTKTSDDLESRLVYSLDIHVGPDRVVGKILVYRSEYGAGYEMHVPSPPGPPTVEDRLSMEEVEARLGVIVNFSFEMSVMLLEQVYAYRTHQTTGRTEPRLPGVDVPDSGTVDSSQG